MKTLNTLLILTSVSGSLLLAQESPKFTFDLGAGFTESVGSTRSALDKTGWNIDGGAGLNISHGFGVKLDLGYNYFGVNGATLGNLGEQGGDVHIFTALVNPVYHVAGIHRFDLYVTGGGGLFHQTEEFNEPVFGQASYGNSFFGLHPGVGVGTEVLSSYSVNKPGYDVGAGIEFGTKWHGKLFGEARYEHMFNTNSHTDFIPVEFGFRW